MPQEVLDNLSWKQRRRMWTRSLSGGQGRGAVYVAEDEDRIVGFASAGPSIDQGEDPDRIATLFAVYLLEEAQGRGVGRDLVDAVLATLRTNAFRAITLWVLEDNAGARGFYEATGWQLDGTGKETFGADDPVELPTMRYRRTL